MGRAAASILASWLATTVDDPVPALELVWDAPPGCPDAGEIRRRVESYLDEQAPMRSVAALGTISQRDTEWALSLQFDEQTKHFTAGTCDDLGDAAAVVLSLALAPASEEPPAPPAKAAAEVDAADARPIEPPAPPRTPDATPPITSPARAPRVQAAIRADAGIGYGITPTLTTTALHTAVVWRFARIELSGTFFAPALASNAEVRPLVTLGAVDARGCGVPSAGALQFPLCGGFAMGALRVDDRGAASRGSHHLWLGAVASAAIVWRFRPWAGLWFGPELWVALRRVRAPLAVGDPYSTGPVAVRGALGVEFYFPSRVRARAGMTPR